MKALESSLNHKRPRDEVNVIRDDDEEDDDDVDDAVLDKCAKYPIDRSSSGVQGIKFKNLYRSTSQDVTDVCC